jgi:hypothetical protein
MIHGQTEKEKIDHFLIFCYLYYIATHIEHMSAPKKKMIPFRCPEELAEAAAKIAECDDRTLSNLLVHLLRNAIRKTTEESSHQHPTAA